MVQYRQAYKPMALNRDPRNKKHAYIVQWTLAESQECTMRREQSLQQMTLGKLDVHMQNNENGSLTYNIHKNQFKWIKDLNVRFKTVKILKENLWGKLQDIDLDNDFMTMTPKAQAAKT